MDNESKKAYKKYVDKTSRRSPVVADSVKAFVIGGAICTIGEALIELYTKVCGLEDKDGATLASVTLIFFAVLLTGLGVFDKIAKHAGAGTLVPITGFANAVSSCAIDARAEGYIFGVGAKIFTIAGPVILYGIVAGTVYGAIYWICGILF